MTDWGAGQGLGFCAVSIQNLKILVSCRECAATSQQVTIFGQTALRGRRFSGVKANRSGAFWEQ
jgi:hypothetical protein